MHIRILNKNYTQLIETRTALDEINHAMMDGKDDVREMSASGSSASIHYNDGRHVVLRPATYEEIEQAEGREWSHAASNISLWHRFNGELRALCNRRIGAHCSGRVAVKDAATGKWVSKDLIGHDELRNLTELYEMTSVVLCPKCQNK